MAFTFTVEDGTGISGANSYVTLEEANDYIEVNAFAATTWDDLEDDAKEKLLVRSSKYLDNIVTWNGTKSEQESGLRWPRTGVYDDDGFLIPDDVIPQVLKDAVCELASYLMSDDWTAPYAANGLKELKVDVIQIDYDTTFSRASLPEYILTMLSGLGEIATGRKPGFKKIIRS